MTLRVKCASLQMIRIFGGFRFGRENNLVQKCFSSNLTHPGNSDDIFMEDKLEEKINAKGSLLTSQHLKPRKKLSPRKEMELQHRRYVKHKIIERKEKAFYGQKQPSLLTWAAKSQIRYLNKKDPIYWTSDMLAQSFPVPKDVIIKILKNNKQLPPDEEYILKHDQQVYMNWLKLKQVKEDLMEGKSVDPLFRSIVESQRLNLMKNAAGSRALPIPVSGYLTRKAVAEKRRPKTKGEFSAILEDYRKQKETVKQDKSTKYIELEDPHYIALLTGISELNAKDDISEEHSFQEETTHDKYEDEVFYDEYDDNLHIDMYKDDENEEAFIKNKRTSGDIIEKRDTRYNRNKSGSF